MPAAMINANIRSIAAYVSGLRPAIPESCGSRGAGRVIFTERWHARVFDFWNGPLAYRVACCGPAHDPAPAVAPHTHSFSPPPLRHPSPPLQTPALGTSCPTRDPSTLVRHRRNVGQSESLSLSLSQHTPASAPGQHCHGEPERLWYHSLSVSLEKFGGSGLEDLGPHDHQV